MRVQYLNWFNRCVTNGWWKLGRPISPMVVISSGLNISKYKARQLVDELIDMGVVEQYGRRFFLISDKINNDPKTSQQNLILKAKINLKMLQLEQAGYNYDKKYLAYIKQELNNVVVYFPLRRSKLEFNILDYQANTVNFTNEITEIVRRHRIK